MENTLKSAVSQQEFKVWMVMDYIDQHISEDLRIETLAALTGYSLAHFIRVFQEETGETPGDFVRRIRLERSANYLCLEKHAPLIDMAMSCGFQSLAVYSRCFREFFGMSPSQWRAGAQWHRCYNEQCWRERCGTCKSGADDFVHLPQIQRLAKHAFSRGKPNCIDYENLRIENLPLSRIAYLRGFGASKIGGWLPLWQRFSGWLPSVTGRGQAPLRAVMHFLDNQMICSRNQSRCDIGLVLDTHARAADIPSKAIEGGLYAMVPFEGNWADALLANEYIWLTLFSVTGHAFDIHRPHLIFIDLQHYGSELPNIASLDKYRATIAMPVINTQDKKTAKYFDNRRKM